MIPSCLTDGSIHRSTCIPGRLQLNPAGTLHFHEVMFVHPEALPRVFAMFRLYQPWPCGHYQTAVVP